MENNIQTVAKHEIELPSYEVLSELAINNPQAFESLRLELINCLIENAPTRLKPRLLGIQFRVEGIRKLSKTTLGATIRISKLMWESFYNMNQTLQDFTQIKRNNQFIESNLMSGGDKPKATAKILMFNQRKSRFE